MADSDFHGFAKDVFHHNYASVAVLTVALCEYMTTLEDEVQYIWLSPWSKTKCTYLFARYFALGYLAVNVFFSLVWPPPIPASRSKCLSLYLQNMGAFCAQYITSHITLSRRILETYEIRNVGSALLVFHVAELAGSVVSGKDTLSAAAFDGVCNVVKVPKEVFVFVGLLLLGQLLMWALIFGGFRGRRGPDSPRPSFREMAYQMWNEGEGKIIWAICCLLFVVNTYLGSSGQTVKPVYLFAWPICLFSIGTCRYILSIERIVKIQPRTPSPKSSRTMRQPHTCDCSNDTGCPPLEHRCHCEPPSFANLKRSNRPHTLRVTYPDSYETLTRDSLRWTHPSCLQEVFDRNPEVATTTTSDSSDLTRRTTTSITTRSSVSTTRRSSISSHTTQETEITVPSMGSRISTDLDIGSIHSSSSASSEELRHFWNEVWSAEEHAFMDP